MATAALTAVEVDQHAERVMARHAKTFYWANRLMPADYRRDLWNVYAFCRGADDAADETPDRAEARALIARMRGELLRESSSDPALAGFLDVVRRRRMPLGIPLELLAGVESDIGAVRIPDERELLRYAYRVASTVGLMVCHVTGVQSPQAHAYAIDLGLAMQLTNIARDVAEDFENDKVYLPATWIAPARVEAAVRGDAPARREVEAAVRRLLALADRRYRSSDFGIRYLPRWSRWGILTASRCYEAIGGVVTARGPRYWDGRCATGKAAKAVRTVGALATALFVPKYAAWGRARPHDPALHVALDGLPGADVGGAA